MKKLLLVLLALSFIFVSPVFGTNTILFSSHVINLAAIDSDWLYTATLTGMTGRIRIESIEFAPAATTDKCVIKEGGATGPPIFTGIPTDPIRTYTKYYDCDGLGFKPFLDVSAGVYNAAATVTIILCK